MQSTSSALVVEIQRSLRVFWRQLEFGRPTGLQPHLAGVADNIIVVGVDRMRAFDLRDGDDLAVELDLAAGRARIRRVDAPAPEGRRIDPTGGLAETHDLVRHVWRLQRGDLVF